MVQRRLLVLVIALVTVASSSASAAPAVADPVPLPPKASPARRHLLYHSISLGVGAVAYLISTNAVTSRIAPMECRWCSVPGFDSGTRNALRWDNTARANSISDFTGLFLPAIVPVGMVFFSGWHEGAIADGIDDSLAVAESAIASGLVTEGVKVGVGRQRPSAHYGDPTRTRTAEDNLSFFSGHTSFAFSIATASGSIASARGYKYAPEIWGIGLGLAATTGYLRIAADAHYLSDVIVGAGVGAAIGFYLPRLLHDHGKIGTRVVPAPGGLAIIGTF